MSVSVRFMPLQMQMKRMILHEKGTVESEYDDEFNDGEDQGNMYGMWIGTIRATGMVLRIDVIRLL